jgi:ubiquinone/menaquinone biosynthesis C-methylase UbiE
LDVFSQLLDGPMEVSAIASACKCDFSGIEHLLDCLTSYRLLEKNKNRYSLTPTSMTFLVRSVKSYAGDWILAQTDPDIYEQVFRSLHSGEPFQTMFPWDQLAWLESYNPARINESTVMWKAADINSKQISRIHVVDLACGSSISSFVLAQKNPRVRVDCVDSSTVLEVARDLAERMGVMGQVSFVSGDIHQLDLGKEKYEVALLSNATNFFTVKQNLNLFQRINQSLTNNGSLIISVTMDTGEMTPHIRQYSLLLWAMSGTSFYNFNEYREWLLSTGFFRIKSLSKLWISAKKDTSK